MAAYYMWALVNALGCGAKMPPVKHSTRELSHSFNTILFVIATSGEKKNVISTKKQLLRLNQQFFLFNFKLCFYAKVLLGKLECNQHKYITGVLDRETRSEPKRQEGTREREVANFYIIHLQFFNK